MALSSIGALETLARQLHDEFTLWGVRAALGFFHDHVLPNKTTVDKDKIMSLFQVVCEKMNLYTSLLVSCMGTFRNFDPEAESENEYVHVVKALNKSARKFYDFALDTKHWSLAFFILQSAPREQQLPMFQSMMEQFYNEPVLFRYSKLILKDTPIRSKMLTQFLIGAITTGRCDLFRFIVASNVISLSEIEGVKNSHMDELQQIRTSVLSTLIESYVSLGQRHQRDMKTMLVNLIANGLSTYQARFTEKHSFWNVQSPLSDAVVFECLPIVKLLYRSGATTNSELFQLKRATRCRLQQLAEAQEDQPLKLRRIYKYVNSASKHPRRLKELCYLAVSHAIGYHSSIDERRKAANTIPSLNEKVNPVKAITYTLKCKVLFKDVLIDFQSRVSRHAIDRDPPGAWM